MVVQGGFSLQLIDAETQQALSEYRGPSGTVYYAEAKPGGEYFLRFEVLREEDTASEDAANKADKPHEGMYYFRPAVDGKDLGFYTNLTKAQGARDVGLWTYVNGVGTNQALKFETAPGDKAVDSVLNAAAVSEEESSTAATTTKTPPMLHMGNVQVQVSKGVFTGYQKRVYTTVPDLTREETVMTETAAPISASSSLQEDEDAEATAKVEAPVAVPVLLHVVRVLL